jgi:non-ribosomal peptide synthetase component E (peptide arylation enzyme)
LLHGGFAIAASELDARYKTYPGFLDAACFAVPCPVMGDRIHAAVVAKPAQSISREALCAFLARQSVAPYKYPERLVVVKSIPRDAQGRVLREELAQAASSFETDLRSSSE